MAKFRDYFDYEEPIGRVPSHRALTVFRGRAQDILNAKLVLPEPELGKPTEPKAAPSVSLAEDKIALHLGWRHLGRPVDDLLLTASDGPRVVMGLDLGIRTGVKVAVVDAIGKLLETATVYPYEPKRDWGGSLHTPGRLCKRHGVNLIAVGNRETDKLAVGLIKLLAKVNSSVPPPLITL